VTVPLPDGLKARLSASWRRLQARYAACRLRKASGRGVGVAYAHAGYPANPTPSALRSGGGLKYIHLDRRWPHARSHCNALYAISSSHFAGLAVLTKRARKLGIPIVWNQDGTYVPFAHGAEQTKKGNAAIAPLLHGADHVFYQSRYAKKSGDRFLGERSGPAEILYNPVDTDLFRPSRVRARKEELVLLSAGSHNDAYRLSLALDTLKVLRRRGMNVRLLVAGNVEPGRREVLEQELGRADLDCHVQWHGSYSQDEAPKLFWRADILLHTQYCDVCPTVVLEAMATGLPVVYSDSGGTPELVGPEAGCGIPTVLDWETARPPTAEAFAEGVARVARQLDRYGAAARRRAVQEFDLRQWLSRHEEVFSLLIDKARAGQGGKSNRGHG